MKHKSQPQSVSWFQSHYKAGRLELRPPFQRKPVWTDKQRSALIESILLDIPIPEIYIQVSHGEEGEPDFGVVDGQQRLRTILQFIGIESEEDQHAEDTNAFKLDKLPVTSVFKDKAFTDLSSEQKKKFFEYEVCVRMLFTEDRLEVEDVFKRLNKYTLPLKPQELRNATYHGAFAALSEALADNEYWAVNRIVSPAAIRRMTDIEMMSDLLIGLMHGPQGGSAKTIDQYYELYEQYDEEIPGQAKLRYLFERALDTIKRLFPDISKVSRWGNRADFYSLFVSLATLLSNRSLPKRSEAGLEAALVDFAVKVDRQVEHPTGSNLPFAKYARAIEKGSNDKARRQDRHEALTTVIEPFLGKR